MSGELGVSRGSNFRYAEVAAFPSIVISNALIITDEHDDIQH